MATRARPSGPAAAPPGLHGDTGEAAVQVLRHFRHVFNAVKTHYRLVEKHTGVGGALVWAMSLIEDQPGIRMGELARRLDIHQSTASNLVKALTERGMVEGRRAEPDRRAVQLHLMPAGAAVLSRAPRPFSGVLHQALGALDAETLGRLEHDLGALIQNLGPAARAGRLPRVEA